MIIITLVTSNPMASLWKTPLFLWKNPAKSVEKPVENSTKSVENFLVHLTCGKLRGFFHRFFHRLKVPLSLTKSVF